MRWALALAFLLGASCGRPPSCRKDSDCPAGDYCYRYFCAALPDAGEDAGDAGTPADSGTTDDGGTDTARVGDGGMACTSHADCPAPQKCLGHVCR